ncbi:MAG TPA: hypothetical protein ENN51_04580 [candidate division WOR-3 bacterium]|uniref:Uncharacterized protein n=1 Tax=candidate division WOR-3 bacterium TaxID=2052148 RepID=A0A7V0XFD5_UNCW3|nr:hypothetical protein [candidate division WOR-3 bacterium]
MKYTSLERIWAKYPNKYKALNLASLLARGQIEKQADGEKPLPGNVFENALKQLVETDLRYEKLTTAEVEALTREGYGESHTRSWREPSAFGRTFF